MNWLVIHTMGLWYISPIGRKAEETESLVGSKHKMIAVSSRQASECIGQGNAFILWTDGSRNRELDIDRFNTICSNGNIVITNLIGGLHKEVHAEINVIKTITRADMADGNREKADTFANDIKELLEHRMQYTDSICVSMIDIVSDSINAIKNIIIKSINNAIRTGVSTECIKYSIHLYGGRTVVKLESRLSDTKRYGMNTYSDIDTAKRSDIDWENAILLQYTNEDCEVLLI